MGLRCILGHDFGDRQSEGEREDRGDEVVVTMREYRECARCGYRRIISENKEVKPNEETTGDDDDPPSVPSTNELIDDEEPFEELSAAEDDGMILDDDDETPVRGHGEWPAHDTGEPVEAEAGSSEWPNPIGEDEGFSAEPSDGRPLEDVEFTRGGLTPEARPTDLDDDDHDAGAIMNTTGRAERASASPATNIRRAQPGPSPSAQQRDHGVDTVFVCPECEHETPGIGASLRSGDICPECHRGYMVEREQ